MGVFLAEVGLETCVTAEQQPKTGTTSLIFNTGCLH